jgi:hypothetical protein
MTVSRLATTSTTAVIRRRRGRRELEDVPQVGLVVEAHPVVVVDAPGIALGLAEGTGTRRDQRSATRTAPA